MITMYQHETEYNFFMLTGHKLYKTKRDTYFQMLNFERYSSLKMFVDVWRPKSHTSIVQL